MGGKKEGKKKNKYHNSSQNQNFVRENKPGAGVSGLHNNYHHKGIKHYKKGKFNHKQKLEWLRLKSDYACDLNCKDGEVCISGPVEAKPICIRKKDLKKREKKAWKKFQKQKYYKSDEDFTATVGKKEDDM